MDIRVIRNVGLKIWYFSGDFHNSQIMVQNVRVSKLWYYTQQTCVMLSFLAPNFTKTRVIFSKHESKSETQKHQFYSLDIYYIPLV